MRKSRTRSKRSKPRWWVLAAACALVASLLTAASAFAARPSVDAAYTSGLTAESVVLNAEINPSGVETTYRFEYGTTPAYGKSLPEGEAVAGSGASDVLVNQHISGLVAGTQYHYRVIAKNAGGETVGVDHTFSYQLAAPSGEGCPNASLRTGSAARLPDCRAYEQVTPPGIEPYFQVLGSPGNLVGPGIRALGEIGDSEASVSGERLLIFSTYPLPGAGSYGVFSLASRTPGGWSSEDPVPPQSVASNQAGCTSAYFPLTTPELTNWVLADGYGQGHRVEYNNPGDIQEHFCPTDEPELVAGEPQGFQNLFVHDAGAGIDSGSYQLVDTPQSASEEAPLKDAWAQGASEDLSRVVFTEAAQLTPQAPAILPPPPPPPPGTQATEFGPSEDLYVWSGGAVRLVTVLPDGEAVAGTLANGDRPHTVEGFGSATFTHAISSDAGRVAFEAAGNLYVRENAQQPPEHECTTPATACTVQLDARQGGTGSGGGHFEWASSNGSRVFFTDEKDLVAGANASAGKPDLYEYDFERTEGERLKDVTAGAGAAGVLGVSGASEDGSRLYFVATAALTGAQANSQGAAAQPGQPNLYLREVLKPGTSEETGEPTFVATLGASDSDDWRSPPTQITARASQDGGFIAFDSLDQLTGYDNHGPCVGGNEPLAFGPCQEIFLYDAERGSLSCASCSPGGELPTGPARIGRPGLTNGTINEDPVTHLQRFVSDSGQVFFNTVAHLLPADTNGLSNVYEYEGGQLRLLSPGSTSANAYFAEAGANGENVFLLTSELLGDTNGDVGLFDARVGGGFPAAPEPVPPCGEGDCAPPAAPPTFSTPAGAAFSGPGNPPLPASIIGPPKPKTATQIRAEELAKALKACRTKHDKRKRASCETQAHRRYGAATKANNATKSKPGDRR
jgi:hypothetical protein